MKHSGFGRELEQTRFPSTGYKIVNNNMTTPNIPSMSQLYGCGDIYTSAHDLYLFNEALFWKVNFKRKLRSNVYRRKKITGLDGT